MISLLADIVRVRDAAGLPQRVGVSGTSRRATCAGQLNLVALRLFLFGLPIREQSSSRVADRSARRRRFLLAAAAVGAHLITRGVRHV